MERAAASAEILVTYRGKPRIRLSPADSTPSCPTPAASPPRTPPPDCR
jgi:antitoxin (DNA-binding transcriptional repressor) of toxin-antitoxin stability system